MEDMGLGPVALVTARIVTILKRIQQVCLVIRKNARNVD